MRDDMYGIDSALLMNPAVWEASGHTTTFNDPLVTDAKTRKRYRADHLLEEAGIDPAGMTLAGYGGGDTGERPYEPGRQSAVRAAAVQYDVQDPA